ncbi:thioesterase II family protein [Streptomyces massasporeus]|uniref:thioesterase II family protein n=1 Tax=Streptomyces massasporeus TaxID=67324 RepID=UPI0037F733DC
MTVPRSRWLLRDPDPEAATRLFCFPYGGMGASMYAAWPRHIGTTDVVVLQPPGRENRMREPHPATFEEFAAEAAAALEPYLDRPFAFFGHCAASLPVHATARRLARDGLPAPERLYVSAQVPPHQCPRDRFLELDRQGLTDELSRIARALGQEPSPLLLDMALDVLEGDLEASRHYTMPAPEPLPSAITALHWRHHPEIPRSDMEAWSAYTGEFRLVDMDGDHHSFMAAPGPLLDLVEAHLADAATRLVAVSPHPATKGGSV